MGQACVTLHSDAMVTNYACVTQHWRCGKSATFYSTTWNDKEFMRQETKIRQRVPQSLSFFEAVDKVECWE